MNTSTNNGLFLRFPMPLAHEADANSADYGGHSMKAVANGHTQNAKVASGRHTATEKIYFCGIWCPLWNIVYARYWYKAP